MSAWVPPLAYAKPARVQRAFARFRYYRKCEGESQPYPSRFKTRQNRSVRIGFCEAITHRAVRRFVGANSVSARRERRSVNRGGVSSNSEASRSSWIAKLTLRAICDCVSLCVGIRLKVCSFQRTDSAIRDDGRWYVTPNIITKIETAQRVLGIHRTA